MSDFQWPVVPVCKRQRRDVREEDLLCDGVFRKCDVTRYRSQRDLFAEICKKRLKVSGDVHFVAQLYGCVLDCPYCYVTRDGIWGNPVLFTSSGLVVRFLETDLPVFHLMGGAPGLYLERWYEVIDKLCAPAVKGVFHSDLLLTEKPYDRDWFGRMNLSHSLVAINVKGVTSKDYGRNTRRPYPDNLFWRNLEVVVKDMESRSYNPYYITFTNPNVGHLPEFKRLIEERFGPEVLEDSFVIDTVKYEALK